MHAYAACSAFCSRSSCSAWSASRLAVSIGSSWSRPLIGGAALLRRLFQPQQLGELDELVALLLDGGAELGGAVDRHDLAGEFELLVDVRIGLGHLAEVGGDAIAYLGRHGRRREYAAGALERQIRI